MLYTCYYCNKELPGKQIKRCSRCLLVTYCSKECQSASWKASHKNSCKVHPSVAAAQGDNGPSQQVKTESEVDEQDMKELLELDRLLSRWMQYWRACFTVWTRISLDLANHPRERVMTHCMQIVVQPRIDSEDIAYKQFKVLQASVESSSDIKRKYPELELTIDPEDFTRLRFVLIMVDSEGELRRVRLLQWNDPSVDRWRNISKKDSAALGGPNSEWDQALITAVNEMNPNVVRGKLGLNR